MLARGEEAEDECQPRTSFILRCWLGPDRQVRALLIECRSGIQYPLATLAHLPALLETLLVDSGRRDRSVSEPQSRPDEQREK